MGKPNVDEMLRGLTAVQFLEWQEYARLEPFDEVRGDYRVAQVVQAIMAVNLKKGGKLPSLVDLVLKWESDPVKPKQDWRRMKEITQMIAEAYK